MVFEESSNLFNQVENKFYASLVVTPQTTKVPSIGRVILLNRGKENVNKAAFDESLSAQARTANLFGKEITFYLWEEGTSEANKYKKPKKKKVNKNGVAEVKFNLLEYASQKTLLDFFTSTTKTTRKFYVTAVYENKKATSKGAVEVDKDNEQDDSNFINKTAEIVAEGKQKIEDSIENVRTTTSVGMIPQGKNEEESKDCKCCRIDEEFFFENYQIKFPTKNKKGEIVPLSENLKSSLRIVFKGIKEYYSKEKKDCDVSKISYLLATAKHETGSTFNPVEEANWLSWKIRKKYFEEMYDPILGKNEKRRSMALKNENNVQGDGVKYFGRGYVQITWKKNYRKMGEKFGVDLVNNPEKVLDPDLAMKIMIYGSEEGKFTGVSLNHYINSKKTDYYNARRVINGTDKASTIEGYATKIESCLKIKKCTD
ncbi:hypothetical protein IV494_14515 [Kaistella sp. G5-32]|uniref:Glycoside hydrolase family 19 catalytic domain-containing protein n=1 Tax=Kaistella gelatinilytica TaxID=2787636 RepID=A0ABS0FF98_9FLAO|nr:glycoside hydrolase family 19 protein [Kaistella gelatinilytica]MBF8458394.1 hypothetical protein [Kaistella gelatinilytica]